MKKPAEYLKSSRFTAVNLTWTVDKVMKKAYDIFENKSSDDIDEAEDIVEIMDKEAVKIHEKDIRICKDISQWKERSAFLRACKCRETVYLYSLDRRNKRKFL